MKNKLLLTLVAVLVLVGAGFALINNNKNNPNSSQTNTTDKKISVASQPEVSKTTQPQNPGNYITLDEYNADPAKYTSTTKVHFFHATWCPICQQIHKDIEADMSKIPANTTFIKTDFDKETELRKKYGVTTQYTFVQIDKDGNEIAQWTATNLDKALAGLKI